MTLRCNQHCTYCTARRPTDDVAWVQPSAVKARIEKAIHAGAKEIVLSGGEPTLRRDLAQLVTFTHALGARVWLETNNNMLEKIGAYVK